MQRKTANYNHAPTGDRIPPHDIDMEMAVLGALMLEPTRIDAILPILKPESFYRPEHQTIYTAIKSMMADGKRVDILTVTDHLRKSGELDDIGGPVFVTGLTSRVASASHVEQHAYIVQDLYIQRELIGISANISSMAYDGDDPLDIISAFQSRIDSILTENQPGHTEHISELIRRRVVEIERIATHKTELIGIPSGLTSLDRKTGGWQNSDLIIIAGRPSQGKTAFALFSAIQSATFGFPVAIFSLEMSKNQLTDRAFSTMTALSPLDIRSGRMEWPELESGIGKLERLPVFIDDTPALTLVQLRSKVMQLKKHRIALVVVDYLQLMRGDGNNREQEISSISRGLKAIAKEMNVPVIALSQLNRMADGKRPVLANLRESGAIEQDADVVVFIHRPEKYGQETTDDGASTRGLCELIIDKHRNGPTGLVTCYVNEYCTQFGTEPFMAWQNETREPVRNFYEKDVTY
jgi:replicative DNA helicase